MTTQQIPHSVEAEQAVLGALIIDPEQAYKVGWLKADHFYIQRNRMVYEAMLSVLEIGTLDIVTLSDQLERAGVFGDVGGSAYLMSLLNATPTAMNIEQYGRIVLDHAQRRMDLQIANKIATGAYGEGVDRAAIIDMLTKNTQNTAGAAKIGSLLDQFYSEVEARARDPRDVWGISSGIPSLDKSTGGFQSQQTTMLAGAPGVGKTTLLLQLLLEAAKGGNQVAIYELEMDANRLIARIISMLTGVPIRNMKSGRMDNHWQNFNAGIERLEKLPLHICDNPVMNTAQIRADVARIKALHGLDLVGLDYLNLLTDRDSDDDNKNTTAKAVRFRQMCREFDVSGISVQSLNKEGMKAVVPTLAEMSGPAEVGFSADNVFFLVGDADDKTKYQLLPAKMRDSDSGRKPIYLRKPDGRILFAEEIYR